MECGDDVEPSIEIGRLWLVLYLLTFLETGADEYTVGFAFCFSVAIISRRFASAPQSFVALSPGTSRVREHEATRANRKPQHG